MKKAGILTYHCADNYGAILQCYALKKVISSNYPDVDVQVINYRPDYIVSNYSLITKKGIKTRYKNNGLISTAKYISKRLKLSFKFMKKKYKFSRFRSNYLNLTHSIKNINKFDDYIDFYIAGSDQIWNPDISMMDNAYFLKFGSKNSTRISYAASIGLEPQKIPEELTANLTDLLKDFDYISIREKSHLDFVQKYTDKKVITCLDPTLLMDSGDWVELINNRKNNKNKYILLYCFSYDKEMVDFANQISDEFNLKVIHPFYGEYKHNIHNPYYCFYYEGPVEFVDLVKNAEIVISHSFHGTVFSLLFHKEFYTFPKTGRSSRMLDLLHDVGLEERFLTKCIPYTEANREIDWAIVDKRLEDKRKLSLEYLKTALNGQEFD